MLWIIMMKLITKKINKMKSTELRIGNYIKLMFNYEDYETIQVTSDELVDVDKKQADYEPFPLTEDWLYKFGFKNIDKGGNDYITYTDPNHDYYLQLDVRRKDNKYLILDNSFDDLRAFSMVDIEYVHQLQNLYFALTGKELDFEEFYNETFKKDENN